MRKLVESSHCRQCALTLCCALQIKDKLIFEQQKMDAFQQRKDRTEQRKYAKEVGAERAKEKAARKKDALAAVDQWRKDSKAKVSTMMMYAIRFLLFSCFNY
jgi:Eukaryotic rRNA processing protein EBP2